MDRDHAPTTARASITVRASLHADLRKYLPKGASGPQPVALTEPALVRDLLAALGIPGDEIVTVGINGDLGGRDSILSDGDEVTMFSQMEGG